MLSPDALDVLIDETKQQMMTIGQRLYAKGLIAAGHGNLSARIGPDRWLITASGSHKGFLAAADIIVVDRDGRATDVGTSKQPSKQPSSEWSLHQACYSERPDCAAVVHAHPPTTLALSLSGVSMETPVLSEAALTLGSVPVAPYETPTTSAVGTSLRPWIRNAHAVILAHHGAVCIGRTLDEAWRRMETLEHTALVVWRARTLGPVPALPDDEVKRLRAIAAAMNL